MSDVLKKASAAHTRYYTSFGEQVPGATTITGLLNKPALVKWANNLGLEGIDSSKYVDKAAKIGTLIHSMVESHITGRELDLSDYSEVEIETAKIGYGKYLYWEQLHTIEPIFNERGFASEKYRYGGTCDFYCILDGEPTLIDFKSCKAIYDEQFCQVSGYANLLKEQGYKVKRILILRIGRDETEGFEERYITRAQITKFFEIFKNLIKIYYLKKELGWK